MDGSNKLIIVALLLWVFLPDFIPGPIDDYIALLVAINQIRTNSIA